MTVTEDKNNDTVIEVPEPEQTVAVTSQLAEVTQSDDVTEEDIVATSKVIKTLVSSGAASKVKNKTEVTKFVKVSCLHQHKNVALVPWRGS